MPTSGRHLAAGGWNKNNHHNLGSPSFIDPRTWVEINICCYDPMLVQRSCPAETSKGDAPLGPGLSQLRPGETYLPERMAGMTTWHGSITCNVLMAHDHGFHHQFCRVLITVLQPLGRIWSTNSPTTQRCVTRTRKFHNREWYGFYL